MQYGEQLKVRDEMRSDSVQDFSSSTLELLPEYFAVPSPEQQGLALTIKEQERLALALLY